MYVSKWQYVLFGGTLGFLRSQWSAGDDYEFHAPWHQSRLIGGGRGGGGAGRGGGGGGRGRGGGGKELKQDKEMSNETGEGRERDMI